jgi:hypothetical protein
MRAGLARSLVQYEGCGLAHSGFPTAVGIDGSQGHAVAQAPSPELPIKSRLYWLRVNSSAAEAFRPQVITKARNARPETISTAS